ncbi:MAG: hypothetical protein O8C55_11045 [Candidatus Methanoperedens sp.]|nr:hypothetical protein [Candidatus Methanoperedens sp.]
MDDVALYVVGPRKWYINLENAFYRHQIPETFVQYNKSITPLRKTKWGWIEFGKRIDSQINKDGYIKVYGHVSKTWPEGSSCVEYILVVDKYQTGARKSAPLGILNKFEYVAPYFDDYDKIIGKCENEEDFKYETWLHVIRIQKVNPADYSKFVRYDSNEPVGISDLRKVGIFLVFSFDEMEICEPIEKTIRSKYDREYDIYGKSGR